MKLLFVHGFLGSGLNWSPVISKLKSDSWVEKNISGMINPDLLGHGQKARNPEPLTLSLKVVAEDLSANIPDEEFIGIGHSFGLRPLLYIASQANSKLQALIVEDASLVLSSQSYSEISAIVAGAPGPFDSRAEAKLCIEKIHGEQTRLSRFLMTNIRENQSGKHDWRFDSKELLGLLEECKDQPQWKAWSEFKGPIDIILGADSGFVSPARVQECLAHRPGLTTQVVHIAQAGHWVHADQLDAFVAELVKVLKLRLGSGHLGNVGRV